VNDSLRSPLCVRFNAEVVACGVIFYAARRLAVRLPEAPPWWDMFNVQLADIHEVARMLAALVHAALCPTLSLIPTVTSTFLTPRLTVWSRERALNWRWYTALCPPRVPVWLVWRRLTLCGARVWCAVHAAARAVRARGHGGQAGLRVRVRGPGQGQEQAGGWAAAGEPSPTNSTCTTPLQHLSRLALELYPRGAPQTATSCKMQTHRDSMLPR
jgi:hypothetical protein